MKLIILLFFAFTITMNSSYTSGNKRPLNIAHRGLSSIIPENTLQAFEAALYQGADFIQLDVLVTKDKKLIVMHDPFLSQLTDIEKFPQFQKLKQKRIYQQKERTDVWADQLEMAQLKQLGLKQKIVKNRIQSFNYMLKPLSLEEILQAIITFNQIHKGNRNIDGRLGGILIEAKDSSFYREKFNMEVGQAIIKVLQKYELHTEDAAADKCPIILQAFDFQTIKYWNAKSDLPTVFLSKHKDKFQNSLDEIQKYATGVGVRETFFFNYDLQVTDLALLTRIRQKGLMVYCWTFKDDQRAFNCSNSIRMYEIAQKELKLDGIITQFSDVYAPISSLFRLQMYPQLVGFQQTQKTSEL